MREKFRPKIFVKFQNKLVSLYIHIQWLLLLYAPKQKLTAGQLQVHILFKIIIFNIKSQTVTRDRQKLPTLLT